LFTTEIRQRASYSDDYAAVKPIIATSLQHSPPA